jgi:hypothetical protein
MRCRDELALVFEAGCGVGNAFATGKQGLHPRRERSVIGDAARQLKAQMTGKDQSSLGKAIQKLRPDLDGKDVKENVKLAGQQSSRDIAQASAKGKDRVATSIASDSKLSARLTGLLPPGMTLTQAAAGFKNQGQFIAALEASKNLGIPFADLQDRMTAGESLGAAIHGLKPAMTTAEVDTSVETAEKQAKNVQLDASVNASASASASAK